MLAITLLFANLSKLVAICNILSKYCLCQNRKPFSTCQGNVVHTTASLPHFTVPTGARLTRNIAQSSAVGALCVRLHGGVWGGLCPPLSSPGRLLLGNLCKFGCGAHHCAAQLRFLRRRCVFAATIQHHFRILPPGLGTLSGTKASQHNYYSIPPTYKIHYTPSEMCGIQSFKKLRA